MPSKHLNTSWLRELRKPQCPLLQAYTINRSLSSSTALRRFNSIPVNFQEAPSSSVSSSLHTSTRHVSQMQQQQQLLASLPGLHSQSRRASRLANAMMPRAGTAAENYVAYGLTQRLFEACSIQADYKIPQVSQKGAQVPKNEAGEDLGVGEGWWYEDLGLVPTFSTWSQVTFLHMYLLIVRLRTLPTHESLQTYSRHLIDHFSHNAEHRMDVLHGFTSRAIRNKFLKDLFIQWRGVIAAYDEGLIKGDAVLGAAVWRNLWKASQTSPDGKEDMDWVKIAQVVAYMRRVLSELSQVHEAELIFHLTHRNGGKPGIFGYSELDKKLAEGKR